MKFRRYILAGVIAAVVIAGFLAWNWKFKVRIEAKEFVGRVERIESDRVFLKGVFLVDGQPYRDVKDWEAEVLVNDQTRLNKTLLYLPTVQELKKTGGFYKVDDLKKDVVSGTLADFDPEARELAVQVKAEKNIFKKRSFTAQQIDYILPVYP